MMLMRMPMPMRTLLVLAPNEPLHWSGTPSTILWLVAVGGRAGPGPVEMSNRNRCAGVSLLLLHRTIPLELELAQALTLMAYRRLSRLIRWLQLSVKPHQLFLHWLLGYCSTET